MSVITRFFSETIFSEHLETKSDINCNGGRNYKWQLYWRPRPKIAWFASFVIRWSVNIFLWHWQCLHFKVNQSISLIPSVSSGTFNYSHRNIFWCLISVLQNEAGNGVLIGKSTRNILLFSLQMLIEQDKVSWYSRYKCLCYCHTVQYVNKIIKDYLSTSCSLKLVIILNDIVSHLK